MTLPALPEGSWLRKMMFLAGNLAGGFVVASLAIAPIFDFFSDRESHIASQHALLLRMKSVASQEATAQAVERETVAQLKRGELVTGANDGIVNAELQTRLKAKAVQSGAQLRSVQALSPRTSGGVRYLGAQLEVFGPLPSIQRTLHAIETGIPYHFISAAVMKPSSPAHNSGGAVEPTINARLEIFVGVQLDGQKP